MSHHTTRVEVAPGYWDIARPLRDTSWWHRRKQERACGQRTGHCWHPASVMGCDWWCCMCSADKDGTPPQRCVHCTDRAAVTTG